MNTLTGKVAAITGAAKGIGAAAAERFLAEDVKAVALIDMNLGAAEATAKQLDPTGKRAFAFQCNVANFEQVTRCFKEIEEKLGGVDILVNSAGIVRDKTIIKMTPEEWKAVIAVDLNSLFYCTKAVRSPP